VYRAYNLALVALDYATCRVSQSQSKRPMRLSKKLIGIWSSLIGAIEGTDEKIEKADKAVEKAVL
jgi:hypothetical protein